MALAGCVLNECFIGTGDRVGTGDIDETDLVDRCVPALDQPGNIFADLFIAPPQSFEFRSGRTVSYLFVLFAQFVAQVVQVASHSFTDVINETGGLMGIDRTMRIEPL